MKICGSLSKRHFLVSSIWNIYHVRSTNEDCVFEEIPEFLCCLTNLTSLAVIFSEITTIPENIGNLESLTTLSIYGCNLTTLPDSIGRLTSLKSLYLFTNLLENLPDSLVNLVNLKTLNINQNNFDVVPECIIQLSSLEKLSFSHTKIDEIPEWITELSNLKCLDCSSCQIKEIPDNITNLKSLNQLCLNDNDSLFFSKSKETDAFILDFSYIQSSSERYPNTEYMNKYLKDLDFPKKIGNAVLTGYVATLDYKQDIIIKTHNMSNTIIEFYENLYRHYNKKYKFNSF